MAASTDKITGGIVIIGGIGIMGLLAGISDSFGNVMLIIMVGFLVGFLLTSYGQGHLSSWVNKIGAGSGNSGTVIV